jgi:glutathione S-transferase
METSMDDTVLLHHAPMSRSNIVSWMLEEMGIPYRVNLLSLERQEQKNPAFLAINPMGKVPALEHRGIVVTEAAAICAYLADAFPETKLAPKIDDPLRGPYCRWIFFAPGSLEPAAFDRMNGRSTSGPRASSYGDYDTTIETAAMAVAKGPYVLGERFSAADVVLGSHIIWDMMMKALPERPDFTAYGARLKQRPAWQRSMAKNQELYAQLHPKT